jgi:hypothetical protein
MNYKFFPIGLQRNSSKLTNIKTICPFELIVLDADFEPERRFWKCGPQGVVVCSAYERRQGAYDKTMSRLAEKVLGRLIQRNEQLVYNNRDSLDLRKENLIVLPIHFNVVRSKRPNSVVSTLEGYEQALEDRAANYSTLVREADARRGYALSRSTYSNITPQVVEQLLDWYISKGGDGRDQDSRLPYGIDLNTTQCFLQEDLNVFPVPSENQIRRILRGQSLWLPGREAKYEKISFLLPNTMTSAVHALASRQGRHVDQVSFIQDWRNQDAEKEQTKKEEIEKQEERNSHNLNT